MFYKATKFNGDVSNWDVSSVTDMDVSYQPSQICYNIRHNIIIYI